MEYYSPMKEVNYWYKQELEWISKALGLVKEALHKQYILYTKYSGENQNSICLWG